MRRGSTWLDACAAFLADGGAPGSARASTDTSEAELSEVLELLGAFRSADPRGGPPPPPEPPFAGSFVELEAELLGRGAFPELVEVLAGEVDRGQAELFARRFLSVDHSLSEAPGPRTRVLRVGLRMRLVGMLAAPGVRALRVRALADFYYSWLGRYLHRERAATAGPQPSLSDRLAGLKWREVEAGLEHGHIAGPTDAGPVYINLLRVDPTRIRVVAHDCREAVARGLEFGAYTRSLGASAAVSGGFFLYSEPDIEAPSRRYDPVGLLVAEGRVLSPPLFRRGSVLVGEGGAIEVARLGLEAATPRVRVGGTDHALALEGARTRAQGTHGPAGPSVAVVGMRVTAVGAALPIPLNGVVVPIPPELAAAIEVGAFVDWGELRSPSGARILAGVAGGPLLVEAGEPVFDLRGEDFWGSAPPVTFSQDETGDRNLLPRLAAGLDGDGRLIFAAVDGRDFDRALGLTLAELGALMRGLGCVQATNLDGGSSKRMVVAGETLDLTSTEIRGAPESVTAAHEGGPDGPRIRPVHTALLCLGARGQTIL